jgi:hypothetical protein
VKSPLRPESRAESRDLVGSPNALESQNVNKQYQRVE